MKRRFEANRSEWSMTVAMDDLETVMSLKFCPYIDQDQDDGIAVVCDGRHRVWVVGSEHEFAWVVTPGSPGDPRIPFAVPFAFVDGVFTLSVQHDGAEAVIFRDTVEKSFVGSVQDRYIVADPIERSFLSFVTPPIEPHGCDDVVTLSTEDLLTLVDVGVSNPKLGRKHSTWHPHLEIEAGDGIVVGTVDWRRFGFGRSTCALPARTTGTLSLSFNPLPLGWLMNVHNDSTTDGWIHIDPVVPTRVCIATATRGMCLGLVEDVVRRNHLAVCEAIAGIVPDYPGPDDVPMTRRLGFVHDGREYVITPVEREGTENDVIVVSTDVAEVWDEAAPDLRIALNRLNDGVAGATFTLDGRVVVASTHLAATDVSRLPSAIAVLEDARARSATQVGVIPLFSD